MHQYVLVSEKQARDPTSARGPFYSVLSFDDTGSGLIDRSEILSFEFKGEISGFNFYRTKENVAHQGGDETFRLFTKRTLDFIVDKSGIVDFAGDQKGYVLKEIDAVEADRLISQVKRIKSTWTSARAG